MTSDAAAGSNPIETLPVPAYFGHCARRLTKRANIVFLMAGLVLLTVFALLGFGAYIFATASGIAAEDIAQADPVLVRNATIRQQALVSEVESLGRIAESYRQQAEIGVVSLLDAVRAERELNAARGKLRIAEHKIRVHRQTGAMSGPDDLSTREELRLARDTLGADVELLQKLQAQMEANVESGFASSVDLQLVRRELASSERDLQYLDRLIGNFEPGSRGLLANPEAVTPPVRSQETTQIIQTNITRFGTLLLVFFFIRILIPIYRYHVRLGAFYNGRADALILAGETGTDDLEATAGAMTPTLSFDKTPATPLDNTFQLIRELVPMLVRR